MSAQEIGPRPGYHDPSPTSRSPPSSLPQAKTTSNGMGTPTAAFVNIGEFVESYKSMMELVQPLRLVGITLLAILRWENYFLTLLSLFLLCILFYHPALLAGSVVGGAILVMAVGKYYSQSKQNLLLRHRQQPQVEYLDEDYQALRKCQKAEKASHKVLMEYRQIICNTQVVISMANRALDYMYRIIFWKSLEVSLCVTVLLCVSLALLCVVRLQVICASLPLLILCVNRHFITRTVELWRSLFKCLFRVFQLKKRTVTTGSREGTTSTVGDQHHHQGSEMGEEAESEYEDLGNSQEYHNSAVPAPGASLSSSHGATSTTEGGGADREGAAAPATSKGSCYKCNTSFAKLLKRKHDCSSCGQTFCGSCTVKVKRAALGATSPAAYEESVRVCLDCKNQLDDLSHLKSQ